MKGSNEKEKFYEILRRSWSRETCFYKLQELWNENNPSYGQCAITTLILNDLFGGKIMRCMVGDTSHYYNLINGRIVDFTIDQFGDISSLDYSKGEERSREYLLGSEDTKIRYLMLLEKVKRGIIESKNVENLEYNILK